MSPMRDNYLTLKVASAREGAGGAAQVTEKRIGYTGAHHQVRRLRGHAKEHACLHCGGQARDWAYDHQDPNPGWESANGVFSRDPERYIPLCVLCHKRFDDRMRGGPRTLGKRRPQGLPRKVGKVAEEESPEASRGVLWAEKESGEAS